MKTKTLLLRRALFLCAFLFGILREGFGQPQDVFSRSEVNTGLWWDGANPWWYSTWGTQQNRPDNNNGTRNYVKIGHNNNLTMTTNGAFFALASLDFQAGASSPRTIAAGDPNSGLSFTIGIYNASTANHIFSTNIGVDASTVNFQNNNSGGMVFSGNIYLNSNIAQFGGSGNGNFDVSGVLSGTGGVVKNGTNSLVLTGANTYTGSTTINAGTLQLNKTGGGTLPNTNSITVNNGGTLRISSNQTLADLTINSGGTVLVDANVQLTLNGTLTNNGTLTLENGATFLQDPLSTITSGTTGTFNVKQTVTGAGGAGSAPTGRFWYMGVPLNNLTRGTAFGSAGTDNRLWSWTESGQPQWSSPITDNNAPLVPTTGYVFRTSAPSTTLNFSGTSLYSIDASIPNLSNSGGSFAGCHLMSNPYTAYLDWEQIFTASTNISSTYCIPTSNGSSMVYDTYNATGNVAVFPSGVAMTNFIAPMQAFWVVVNPSTQGTLNMTRAMLSHQSGAVGLKDITSFPAFARLNLVSGDFYDQVVVYTDANATSEVEDYDSKKFFLPNKPQVYFPVGNDKLVINALKQGKAQASAPLTVELPSTQVYKFEMAESFVENGLVILEDKQEGIFQDMGVNPVFEFFGGSGVVADRFVLHFQLPNGTNNEGQAGIEDLTSGQIAVIADNNGAVIVALSADLTTSGDIQIFDGTGRLVAQKAITSAQTSLQLNNGTGVYFVRVQTPMKTETKKVMVY